MVKTILYATDLGLYGSYLLQHVMGLASHFNARVVVVHAVDPLGVFAESVLETYLSQQSKEELQQGGLDLVLELIRERVLDAFKEELIDGRYDVDRIEEVLVATGKPVDVILNAVEKCGADIIVAGNRSHEPKLTGMLGSVANKLVSISPIPIYLVPMWNDD